MTIKENIAYAKYFGIKVSFWKLFNKLVHTFNKGSLSWKIHDKNNNVIEEYISSICHRTVNNAQRDDYVENDDYIELNINPNVKLNSTIWMMWWQGEKNAPPIVKACINSVRKNSNGHPVIIIDENNYKDYVKVPDFVMQRYLEGQNDNSILSDTVLTKTHFSDIIRVLLLYQYGGIWADATIFLTDVIPESYFTNEFTTIGEDDEWYIGRGKWSIWFIGCHAGNLLMKFIYQMLCEYWKEKKYWINYLMVYSIMDIGYKKIEKIKNILNLYTSSNRKALVINRKYNYPTNPNEMEQFLKQQTIHKLSWRWWGNQNDSPINIYTEEGQITYFGYIYQKYLNN